MDTKKIEVTCKFCGKKRFVAPSDVVRSNFCDKECRENWHKEKRIELNCPICDEKYICLKSKIKHHRTCGKQECRTKWLQISRIGKNNPNYRNIEDELRKTSVTEEVHKASRTIYQHVVKQSLGLSSVSKIPSGYVIHHKDANHLNNDVHNLVLLPKETHRLIHTRFGNLLIRGLHTGKITREVFFSLCNDEEKKFYENIIDLDVTCQVVVKQGELLENPEEDNQQPSIYRNIIEGSTTNSRVLADNAEDGNTDTSALPDNIGDDIV